MEVNIILFYKFVEINNPNKVKVEHQKFCKDLGVKGKIILAKEGINGSISGNKEQVEKYKKWISGKDLFKGIEFKEEKGLDHPFDKMVVLLKNEIIRIDKKLDLNKTGKHISPEEFLESYKNDEVVILDARNNYESKAGKFKKAITPDINSFREFPSFVDNLKISKQTPIVMYCTGGIRCEKASAYMIEKGFTNVSQLHGGIINFCQKLPNTAWEGSCFVFDKRITSYVGQKENPINPCIHCNIKSDQYTNCKLKTCNELIFICPSCQKTQHNCCSIECKKKLLS